MTPPNEKADPIADSKRPLVLFICRKNEAASILAEAILRHLAQGRLQTASAGDTANIRVNPYALECLAAHNIATTGLHSKAWGRFFGQDRVPVQILITLCDAYAAKVNWEHDPLRAHWPTPEPELVLGSPTERRLAFEETFLLLESRIRKFLALPLDRLSDPALVHRLARIGEVS